MSTAELKLFGYSDVLSIAERLAKFYGRHRPDLREQDLSELISCIEELNRIEELIKLDFKNANKISDLEWQKLQLCERVMDVVDTTHYRFLELGFSPKTCSAQWFLSQKMATEARVALTFEHHLRHLSPSMVSHAFFANAVVQKTP